MKQREKFTVHFPSLYTWLCTQYLWDLEFPGDADAV